MSYNGTINNYVKFSKNIGGVRKAYEGHNLPWMYYGGFKFPSLDVLPSSGNVLPAFTPVKVDEVARTIVPMYAFSVKAVDSNTKTITVNKDVEGTRAKVGMKLMALGNSLATAAQTVATISAIDSSASDVDVLTVDNTCVDEDAYALDGDAVWGADAPILERRIVPIPDLVKKALKDADCVFKFSNRK